MKMLMVFLLFEFFCQLQLDKNQKLLSMYVCVYKHKKYKTMTYTFHLIHSYLYFFKFFCVVTLGTYLIISDKIFSTVAAHQDKNKFANLFLADRSTQTACHQTLIKIYSYARVKFSNFYLLIGWRIKSYFANSENFWPCGLHKGQKRPKNEILAYESEQPNSWRKLKKNFYPAKNFWPLRPSCSKPLGL